MPNHNIFSYPRGDVKKALAEKAGISRSLLSAIEAPGTARNFSLEVFFDLADALDIDPAELINLCFFPELSKKKK